MSLAVGGIAIAAASVIATGGWWLTVVFGAVVIGALWEIWRAGSRVSRVSNGLIPACAATVFLAAVGPAVAVGLLPSWLYWGGALSFAVAYIEYLAAYARGRNDTRPTGVNSD